MDTAESKDKAGTNAPGPRKKLVVAIDKIFPVSFEHPSPVAGDAECAALLVGHWTIPVLPCPVLLIHARMKA